MVLHLGFGEESAQFGVALVSVDAGNNHEVVTKLSNAVVG
jgi:hypothetical protein